MSFLFLLLLFFNGLVLGVLELSSNWLSPRCVYDYSSKLLINQLWMTLLSPFFLTLLKITTKMWIMNSTWGHIKESDSILNNFHVFLLSRKVISIYGVLMLVGLQLKISPNILIFGITRKHEHIKHFEINN